MSQIQDLLTPIPDAYFSDERAAIQEMAREFALKEVLPIANQLDPEKGEIPPALRQKLGELGFFGLLIPEEYGGLGLGVFEYCLVTEELSRAWMSVASIIARANMIGHEDFLEMPVDDPKARLAQMARGEFLGSYAMSEPGAGSDIAGIRCRADLDGDEWVINGQKMWATFALGSDFIVLVARTEPYDINNRHAGIRQFYIPKQPGSFPDGIEGTAMRKIGYHGWRTWELSFDNYRIPKEYLIGRKRKLDGDDGFKRTAQFMAVPRVHTAARAIGLARGSLEDSLQYAQERVQFEKRISDFQYTRFRIADMATKVEAARALTYSVANDADQGVMRPREAAMCKLFASEIAEEVTSNALQIYGGAGYTTEYPIERYWRDARLTKIFEGTSEIQMKIISDSLLPRAPRS